MSASGAEPAEKPKVEKSEIKKPGSGEWPPLYVYSKYDCYYETIETRLFKKLEDLRKVIDQEIVEWEKKVDKDPGDLPGTLKVLRNKIPAIEHGEQEAIDAADEDCECWHATIAVAKVE